MDEDNESARKKFDEDLVTVRHYTDSKIVQIIVNHWRRKQI